MTTEKGFNKEIKQWLKSDPNSSAVKLILEVLESESFYKNNPYMAFDNFCFKHDVSFGNSPLDREWQPYVKSSYKKPLPTYSSITKSSSRLAREVVYTLLEMTELNTNK